MKKLKKTNLEKSFEQYLKKVEKEIGQKLLIKDGKIHGTSVINDPKIIKTLEIGMSLEKYNKIYFRKKEE